LLVEFIEWCVADETGFKFFCKLFAGLWNLDATQAAAAPVQKPSPVKWHSGIRLVFRRRNDL
jgi:hypothetical protein